jgi:hypothetical protein
MKPKFPLIEGLRRNYIFAIPVLAATLLAVGWIAASSRSAKTNTAFSGTETVKRSANANLHEPAGNKMGLPAHALGSIVYVNTNTGWIGEPPPDVVAALTGTNADFSSSSSGLVESNSPVSGTMVDLQGRFQSAMSAELDSNGHFSTVCGLPGAKSAVSASTSDRK